MPPWPTASFPYTFPIIWGSWPSGVPFLLQVAVAFDSDPFDAVPIWTDITHDVQSVSIKRGRQTELARMEAGTATIRLKNHSGWYYANNTSGPYYGKLLPGKAVSIRASYGAAGYFLFTGFATGWPPQWLSPTGGLNPVVDITCVDLIKNLANFDLNTTYASELSGTRVNNVLDDIGWPAGLRSIDAGQSQLKAATGSLALSNTKALTHLFSVQDSELGILYIGANGDVIFEDRMHRFTSPYTVSQAVFGDDVGENYYADLILEYDDQFIFNDIRITNADGGTQQVASDAASQSAYGKRTWSKTELLLTTNAAALDQAGWKLRLYRNPALRARSLKLLGSRDPNQLWPKILGYELSTRVTVRRNEASIDEDYFIEGISHHIDVQSWTWSTSWQLSNATDQTFWLIGTAGFSEIGLTTNVGF